MGDGLRDVDRWFIAAVLPHAAAYRRIAHRLVGPADADDLVQEAYARLIAAPGWRDIDNPRAFTAAIVRNLGLERLRRSRLVPIEALAPLDEARLSDEAPNALQIVSDRDDLKRALALIDALPAQCGKVVRMRKIDGLSPGEIAVRLGLSVSTVEKHLAKGLSQITRAMFADPTPPSPTGDAALDEARKRTQ